MRLEADIQHKEKPSNANLLSGFLNIFSFGCFGTNEANLDEFCLTVINQFK